MKVWRIECPDTRTGPWRSQRGKYCEWERQEHGTGHKPNDGPTACDDCGIDMWEHPDCVCACDSHNQLRAWFRPPHLQELAELGFVLAEYEAEPVARGLWQVVVSNHKHIADHSPLEAIP